MAGGALAPPVYMLKMALLLSKCALSNGLVIVFIAKLHKNRELFARFLRGRTIQGG